MDQPAFAALRGGNGRRTALAVVSPAPSCGVDLGLANLPTMRTGAANGAAGPADVAFGQAAAVIAAQGGRPRMMGVMEMGIPRCQSPDVGRRGAELGVRLSGAAPAVTGGSGAPIDRLAEPRPPPSRG